MTTATPAIPKRITNEQSWYWRDQAFELIDQLTARMGNEWFIDLVHNAPAMTWKGYTEFYRKELDKLQHADISPKYAEITR